MLDVHAPEHPITSAREFLFHLFTITCGLLIALGLEDAASAIHHRSERREAEASIREEMQQNRKDVLAGKDGLDAQIKNMRHLLIYVQARSLNQPADPAGIQLDFTEGSLPDAAWRTASSTGAVSYMPYAEVERLSAAYKEQDLLQTTAEQALDDFLQLGAFMPPQGVGAKLNPAPAEAQAALPYVRRTLAHLEGMYAVGRGLLSSYDEALDGK